MSERIDKVTTQNAINTTHTATPRATPKVTSEVAHSLRNIIAMGATVMAMLASGAALAEGKEGFSTPKRFSAGIDVNPKPRVDETGLPMYPGAMVERNDGENVKGVNLDLWFGSYGMKLVVVKLKTEDSAEQVEAFYRKALAERGDVLDCSRAARDARYTSRKAERRAERDSKAVICSEMQVGDGDDKYVGRDGKVFKAGTRAKQYGVAVQTKGSGATFQLLHLEKRGGDE